MLLVVLCCETCQKCSIHSSLWGKGKGSTFSNLTWNKMPFDNSMRAIHGLEKSLFKSEVSRRCRVLTLFLIPNPFLESLAAPNSLGHAKSTRVFIDKVCTGWKRVFESLIVTLSASVSHVLTTEALLPGQESKKVDHNMVYSSLVISISMRVERRMAARGSQGFALTLV